MEHSLRDRVRALCLQDRDAVDEETLYSIRLSVLAEAADILGIPFDPSAAAKSSIIVMSRSTFRVLDEAWFRISGTFADNRITHQERTVRDRFFANSPHYVERAILFQFLNILTKRETVVVSTNLSMTKTSLLCRILAVDGFRGLLPQHLRNYAGNLNDRLPPVDGSHASATRALYEEQEEGGEESGTVAAGFVLWALLSLYLQRAGSRTDRNTRRVAETAVERVSDFVCRHSRLLQNRKQRHRFILSKLIRRYREEVSDEVILDEIAFRKLVDYGRHALDKYLP